MKQTRNDIEQFIDGKLAGIKTLQALRALKTHVDASLDAIYTLRRETTDQRLRHLQRKELSKWHLLQVRTDIVLQVFIDQALEDQAYLSLPEHERTDKVRYRYLCSFRLDPLQLSKIKGYGLLVKHGWYNRETNPSGVVKDHRFSVNIGWKLKVDPEIMSHPANCELLLNADNIRKSDACSVTLLELQKQVNNVCKKCDSQCIVSQRFTNGN